MCAVCKEREMQRQILSEIGNLIQKRDVAIILKKTDLSDEIASILRELFETFLKKQEKIMEVSIIEIARCILSEEI